MKEELVILHKAFRFWKFGWSSLCCFLIYRLWTNCIHMC